MMPSETKEAVTWALEQRIEIAPNYFVRVKDDLPSFLVDKVREYFNVENIEYGMFSYSDLTPHL